MEDDAEVDEMTALARDMESNGACGPTLDGQFMRAQAEYEGWGEPRRTSSGDSRPLWLSIKREGT